MTFAVIGAGLMGRAALYDLAQQENVSRIRLFDIDEAAANEIARQFGYGKAEGQRLDASDEDAVAEALNGCQAAVACTTYKHNPTITRAAIRAGCHLVDLGGNNDVVAIQREMHDEATQAGVTIVPDCGLAPGMVSVMVADAVSRMDKVDSIKIRVGGLPQSPRPPLNYQMVFSAEGLINEYWESCVILENGQKKTVPPMTDIEELEFDGIGQLEAFYTSGGTSTLPDTYLGQVGFLDYKTIRYPGHCRLFKTMLDLGLGSRKKIEIEDHPVEPRAVLKAVLDTNLSFGDPDLVLVRVTATGEKDGQLYWIVYEIIDRQDSRSGLTAMMRTTAFPAAIIAKMAADGQIEQKGVIPQEVAVKPSLFIPQLKKRGINLVIKEG